MAAESRFERALGFMLKWEGGDRFTDDPDDPGGATRYGISLRFLENLPLELADVDGDGQVGWADVRGMELERAALIYRRKFWDALGLEERGGACLSLVLFDTAVNCGGIRAVRWLQEALGVVVDGQCGPKTQAAWDSREPEEWRLARHVLERRRDHYWDLAKKTEWGLKYIRGWLNRTFDLACEAAELHGREGGSAIQKQALQECAEALRQSVHAGRRADAVLTGVGGVRV